MNKSFKSIPELNAYLQRQINDTLLYDVSDVVRDEIESSAIDIVLGAGEPLYYQRRSSTNSLNSGGIADKSQMEAALIENGVLRVVDNAETSSPWDRRLDEALEFGYGSMDKWYNFSRPFIQEAKDNLEETKAHKESLRDGLIKRGLNVV